MGSKLSVRDGILAELRKSGNASEVRKSCRSMSLFSECLKEYIDELIDKQEKLDRERNKIEVSVASLKAANKRLEEENRLLTAENERLAIENQRLSEEMHQKSSKVEALELKANYFIGRGISFDTLEKISRVEKKSGNKLLDQLERLEERNSIRKESAVLEKHKVELDRKIQQLKKKCDRIDAQKIAKEEKLKTVNAALAEAEAKLDKIENKVIKSINATEYSGLASINDLAKNVRNNVDSVSNDAVEKLKEVGKETTDEINGTGAEAENKIQMATKRTEETLHFVEERVLILTDSIKDRLAEFAEIEQQIGTLKNDVYYGQILFGMKHSTEYLLKIPPSLVVDLLYRLEFWSRINFPNQKIRPSRVISGKDYQLNPFSSYKLEVIFDFLAEEISKLN